MPLRPTYNPTRLDESGWGVIFPKAGDPARSDRLRQSLSPLFDWRQRQAEERFRELEAGPEETATAFLARHGLRPGSLDPERMPYYLLIVASPAEISYDFQAGLSLDYAVGRLWFDEIDGFERYARSLAEYEQREAISPRRVIFFAPANPDDWASNLVAHTFVQPLFERSLKEFPHWKIERVPPETATKSHLDHIFRQASLRLLVTAGPGLAFPPGHPRQRPHQGGIVCQDWPGPVQWPQEISPDFCYTAEDMVDDANLSGMISIHFSDYSLGTPARSTAQAALYEEVPLLAEAPFVARLPQRLLSNPRGGALAAVGMVDRLWITSIPELKVPSKNTVAVVESSLRRLLQGYPLGYALEYFRMRYAELSSSLSMLTEDAQFGKQVDTQELVSTWASMSTARSLAVLGDPAVRIDRLDETSSKMAY